MELRTPIDDVSHRAKAYAWTNLEIWKRFRTEEIEMPFPQMDVHIKETPRSLSGDLSGIPPEFPGIKS